jgi:hypothetical protein
VARSGQTWPVGGGEGLASSVERAPSLMPMANDVIGGAALSG